MIRASIDIGTNSVRLLIAEIYDNNMKLKTLLKQVDIVRLGEGVDKNKNLNLKAIDRCINKLKEYKKIINSFEVDNINIIATSAVRDAQNREIFARRFKKVLNWEFETVTGEEEASLTFLGVKSAFNNSNLIVFDIGGGSTEFIIENQKKTLQIFSINIGSVRMTERFISRFPISSDEYSNMKHAIEYSLNFIPSNLELQGKTLVGVAGTVTTLAAMAQKLSPYDPDKVHKYEISIEKIIALHEEIRAKTPEQIKLMKGIQPARSDVILAGSLICVLIMNKLSLKSLIVSESELLEGIIMKNI